MICKKYLKNFNDWLLTCLGLIGLKYQSHPDHGSDNLCFKQIMQLNEGRMCY